jgi:hypothetical protein
MIRGEILGANGAPGVKPIGPKGLCPPVHQVDLPLVSVLLKEIVLEHILVISPQKNAPRVLITKAEKEFHGSLGIFPPIDVIPDEDDGVLRIKGNLLNEPC